MSDLGILSYSFYFLGAKDEQFPPVPANFADMLWAVKNWKSCFG